MSETGEVRKAMVTGAVIFCAGLFAGRVLGTGWHTLQEGAGLFFQIRASLRPRVVVGGEEAEPVVEEVVPSPRAHDIHPGMLPPPDTTERVSVRAMAPDDPVIMAGEKFLEMAERGPVVADLNWMET